MRINEEKERNISFTIAAAEERRRNEESYVRLAQWKEENEIIIYV